jgi:hypothetical protein
MGAISRRAARALVLLGGLLQFCGMHLLRCLSAALPTCVPSLDARGHRDGALLGQPLLGGRNHGLKDTSNHLCGADMGFLHPHARLLCIHVLKASSSISALHSL